MTSLGINPTLFLILLTLFVIVADPVAQEAETLENPFL